MRVRELRRARPLVRGAQFCKRSKAEAASVYDGARKAEPASILGVLVSIMRLISCLVVQFVPWLHGTEILVCCSASDFVSSRFPRHEGRGIAVFVNGPTELVSLALAQVYRLFTDDARWKPIFVGRGCLPGRENLG
jgi:hypothetical protein